MTREVTLDVTSEGRGKDPWGGERAGYSAKTKIKRSDFGLTWNQVLEAGGVVVGDEIKIAHRRRTGQGVTKRGQSPFLETRTQKGDCPLFRIGLAVASSPSHPISIPLAPFASTPCVRRRNSHPGLNVSIRRYTTWGVSRSSGLAAGRSRWRSS